MVKTRRLYIVDNCLTPYESIPAAAILCQNEKIVAVGGISAFNREPGLSVVNLSGCYAVPGFVDTHIHGAGGFDSSTAYEEPGGLEAMGEVLASHGVTSFIPTVVAGQPEQMLRAVSALADYETRGVNGAEPVGIHIEGPFLNREKHGSLKERDIIDIDLGLLREFIAAGRGRVKLMTFAPELDRSDELVEILLESDVVPSMGHSMADEASVLRAVDAGVTRCTHLFNGMPPLHQRDVALTAVALTDDRIAIELILDGSHLHPRMVDLACRAKPKDKLIGVSDAVQGAGLKDGKYHLGDSEINVKNGRVTTNDGTLAGTTMTLERGWHHLITYSHLKRTEAAACFSTNPAGNLKLNDRGEIRPGKRADIAFFRSDNNSARMTVRAGEVVFDSGTH